MPATMNDLEREREIMNNELIESRFMFAESLKGSLGEEMKAALKEQKKTFKKQKKPSKIFNFLKKLSNICR